jgi:hypothetical protein
MSELVGNEEFLEWRGQFDPEALDLDAAHGTPAAAVADRPLPSQGP